MDPYENQNTKEQIEFEPVLDTSTIESQLEDLRTKISDIFNTDSITGSLDSAVNKFTDDYYNGIVGGYTQFMAQTDSLVVGAQQGISKFINDIPLQGSNLNISGQQDATFFETFFGTGFDYNSPLYKSQYLGHKSAIFNKNLVDSTTNFLLDGGLALAGAGIGAFFGVPGAVTGAIIGGVADLGLHATLGQGIGHEKDVRDIAKNLQLYGSNALYKVSFDHAKYVAENIYDINDTFEAKVKGYSFDTDLKNIEAFSKSGGFQNIRSSIEFEQTVKSIIEDTRTIAKSVGLFQEEVASIMGELQAKGITSADKIKEFMLNLDATANITGGDFASLYNIGKLTVDKLAPMGYGSESAFQLGVDAYTKAMDLNRIDPTIVRNLGGVVNTAVSVLGAQNAVNSGWGFDNLAMYIGVNNTLPTNPIDYVSRLAGSFSIGGYFSNVGRGLQKLSDFDLTDQSQSGVMYAINEMKELGIPVNKDTFLGYVHNKYGMNLNQAQAWLHTATDVQSLYIDFQKDAYKQFANMQTDDYGFWSGLWGVVKSAGDVLIPDSFGRAVYTGARKVAKGITNITDSIMDIDRFRSDEFTSAGVSDYFAQGIDAKINNFINNNKEISQLTEQVFKESGYISNIYNENIDLNDQNLKKIQNLYVKDDKFRNVLSKISEDLASTSESELLSLSEIKDTVIKRLHNEGYDRDIKPQDFSYLVAINPTLKRVVKSSDEVISKVGHLKALEHKKTELERKQFTEATNNIIDILGIKEESSPWELANDFTEGFIGSLGFSKEDRNKFKTALYETLGDFDTHLSNILTEDGGFYKHVLNSPISASKDALQSLLHNEEPTVRKIAKEALKNIDIKAGEHYAIASYGEKLRLLESKISKELNIPINDDIRLRAETMMKLMYNKGGDLVFDSDKFENYDNLLEDLADSYNITEDDLKKQLSQKQIATSIQTQLSLKDNISNILNNKEVFAKLDYRDQLLTTLTDNFNSIIGGIGNSRFMKIKEIQE